MYTNTTNNWSRELFWEMQIGGNTFLCSYDWMSWI